MLIIGLVVVVVPSLPLGAQGPLRGLASLGPGEPHESRSSVSTEGGPHREPPRAAAAALHHCLVAAAALLTAPHPGPVKAAGAVAAGRHPPSGRPRLLSGGRSGP